MIGHSNTNLLLKFGIPRNFTRNITFAPFEQEDGISIFTVAIAQLHSFTSGSGIITLPFLYNLVYKEFLSKSTTHPLALLLNQKSLTLSHQALYY